MTATYRYAYDNKKSIIDVKSISREDRKTLSPFMCISCGTELIPRLGQKVSKHFAHKNLGECSGEGYLHKLAKTVFYNTYKQCIEEHKPFFYPFHVIHRCSSFDNIFPEYSCDQIDSKHYDLTQTFPKVELEGFNQGFRADVLLSSEDLSKILMIEIAVSHECSDEKLKSGIPIIEIKINNEGDVEHLRSADFKEIYKHTKVSRYNLKRNIKTYPRCNGTCRNKNQKIFAFVVYKNGKQYLGNFDPSKLARAINNREAVFVRRFYQAAFDMKLEKHIAELVEEAALENIAVKNCRNCRHYIVRSFEGRSSSECDAFINFKTTRKAERCIGYECKVSYERDHNQKPSNKLILV